MRKYIIGILFILFTGIVKLNAQTPVYYKYDVNGNRLLRTIDLSKTKSAKVDTTKNYQSDNEKKYEETIEKTNITIYPNPTKGELKVDITEFDFSLKSAIYVYNLKGSQITQISPLSGSNIINLSSSANGIYILKIILGDKESKWEIVKE